MNDSIQPTHSGLNLSEPTPEQIEATKKMVQEKYGVTVPAAEAKKLTKLITELEWWLKLDEKSLYRPISVDEEGIAQLQELAGERLGRNVTVAEAQDLGRRLMTLVPYKEKQRLGDEIRGILVTHKEVLQDAKIEQKVIQLFKLRHHIELTPDLLIQIVPLLSRTLWYEEGLDKSLDRCLDDLLAITDKEKRGKKISSVLAHEKVLQAVDSTAEKLHSNI